MNAAMMALFIFGPELFLPAHSSIGPSSRCTAPYRFYEQVALLHNIFLVTI